MTRFMMHARIESDPLLPCYAQVVDLYQHEGSQDPEHLGGVVAASMASMPEAQGCRARFPNTPRSAADQAELGACCVMLVALRFSVLHCHGSPLEPIHTHNPFDCLVSQT
ncbi:hypothetical protein [Cupriavidus taiwanensis]